MNDAIDSKKMDRTAMYHQDVLQSLLLTVLLVTTASATIYISFISTLDLDR